MPARDKNSEAKVLSSPPFHDDSALRMSRFQAVTAPGGETEIRSGGYTAPAWAVPESPGLSGDKVLLSELESLDWRVSRLEVAFVALVRGWTLANRVYRRLGHALLHTPVAGICHRLMGHIAADEKYRRWFVQHRATDRYRHPDITQSFIQTDGPLISLVMPVCQPNLSWLATAVEGIQTQLYQNWQLVVVSDGDLDPDVASFVQSLASEDPRIQYVYNVKAGISSALNTGLSACSGSYTAFIDQKDILESTALSHVAAAIQHGEPDIIYTDEDYITENGDPQLPLFKPAWSPALLLSCMYVGHLLVIATEQARQVGGFRSAYDGAQDHDLILRLTDKGCRVAHIPRVLYHSRQHAGSTALASPDSHEAGLQAVQDALTRRHLSAIVHGGPARHTYRFTPASSGTDSAAIIIPTRSPKLLSNLLESIHSAKSELRREVHVVAHCDGSRTDDEIAAIAGRFGAHVLEYRGPFNFALMNNLAAARISSRYLILMNDDVVVRSEGWLEELCAPFMRPEVGITGALLHYPDGMIEHSGVVTGIGDGVGHAGRFQLESAFWPWLKLTRNVSAVTGACLAIRRTLFEQLGGFDVRFHNNYNDVDLCLRAQNEGFEVVLSTTAKLCHDGGKTRVGGTALHERLDFWTRWGKVLTEVDYFYSPNLSRRLEAIDLSVPVWR